MLPGFRDRPPPEPDGRAVIISMIISGFVGDVSSTNSDVNDSAILSGFDADVGHRASDQRPYLAFLRLKRLVIVFHFVLPPS